MEKNIDFLNYLFKNAQMGVIGIDDVVVKAKAKELKELLYKQKKEYYDFCNEVKMVMEKCDCDVKDIGLMARVGSSFMSSVELAKDHSDSMIAKMMIEGTNKGIIEINEKLNNIPNINKDTKKLAKKLLKMETLNLTELKKYL